ncbi:MAG: glycosyltransferase, partial [Nitrososphaerales archaeon]
EVAFATSARFRPAVEAAGFTFFPAGLDRETDPDYHRLMAELANMPPGPESERVIFDQVFLDLIPRRMATDLLEVARRWQPDMLLRESAELGSTIVAECLGLPYADVLPGVWVKGEGVWLQDAARHLDPLRASFGLDPDPDLEALHPYLAIAISPPSLALRDLDGPRPYPATTHFIHTVYYDQGDHASLPRWVFDLPERPTVYVTMGTEVPAMPGAGYYPRVYQAIVEGLRNEPFNVIVTIGREQDPAQLGPQPPNVHVERYIPQSLLLPHCDVVVSHGGTNTLLQTLDAGLPMVMVPLIADQFMNGALYRTMQLGPVIDLEKLTPEAVRTAVYDALKNATYRKNIDCLRAEMDALPGLDYAVRLVEEVAGVHQPVEPMALAELEMAC